MSASIFLEDGRSLHRSTVAMDGLLWRISQHVAADHPKLRRWLADRSRRSVPFMDMDVRGLLESDQKEFYEAARRAMGNVVNLEEGGSTEAMVTLLKLKDSMDRGEPHSEPSNVRREFIGEMYDLDDDIWGLCDDTP